MLSLHLQIASFPTSTLPAFHSLSLPLELLHRYKTLSSTQFSSTHYIQSLFLEPMYQRHGMQQVLTRASSCAIPHTQAPTTGLKFRCGMTQRCIRMALIECGDIPTTIRRGMTQAAAMSLLRPSLRQATPLCSSCLRLMGRN